MQIPRIETRPFRAVCGLFRGFFKRGGISGGFRAETSMRLLAEQPAASLG